jgi:hypothetical protein
VSRPAPSRLVRAGLRKVPAVPAAVVVLAALVCAGFAGRGPVQFLDAASYAAVTDSLAHGHWFTTPMVPSFSQFSAADFLQRGARIPFVDFPAGYPLLSGLVALFVGARAALMVVGIGASALMAGVMVAQVRGSLWRRGAMAVFAIGLLLLPMYQAVLRAGLSEPLFCALLVGAAAVMLSDRPERLHWAVLLAGLAGTVRFVGLPAMLVPALLLVRARGWRRSWRWVAISLAPAAFNLAVASLAGSGSRVGLREITSTDVRFSVHSITGWTSHRFGGFGALFAGSEWPPVWGMALAACWVIAVGVAIVGLALGRDWLPRQIEITLALAGAITSGLFGGMLLYDSLVSPDNRLMLPAGVLTLTGLAWWACERFDARVALGAVSVWLALAAAPWQLRPQQAPPVRSDIRDAVGDAAVVISDDADAVWWHTGVPAAYLPQPTFMLTGEAVDQHAELAKLPCLLAARDGAIVLVGGPFADQSLRGALEVLVQSGDLVAVGSGEIVRMEPTGQGCPAP